MACFVIVLPLGGGWLEEVRQQREQAREAKRRAAQRAKLKRRPKQPKT